MLTLTVILTVIEVTICIVKPHARSFALIVLVAGLAGRLATIVSNHAVPLERRTRTTYLTFAAAAVLVELALAVFLGDSRQVLASIETRDGPARSGPGRPRLCPHGGGGPGGRSRQLPDPGVSAALIAAEHAPPPPEAPKRR